MSRCYTGVGSRSTPRELSTLIASVAWKLEITGWTLRSGGADGADTWFESAATRKEIFLPWEGFNGRSAKNRGYSVPSGFGLIKQAEAMAAAVHPAWQRCSPAARKLHTRNVFQVHGHDLKRPSKFLICWTPNAATVGGTATAIRLAEKAEVPVFNLARDDDRTRLWRWVCK